MKISELPWWAQVALFALVGFAVFTTLGKPVEKPAPKVERTPEQAQTVSASCIASRPVSERVLVSTNRILMMVGPSREATHVINERASLPRTASAALDLEAVCETDDWILVKIVGADGRKVSWETGWIEKRYLTSELNVEHRQGLYWDIAEDKNIPTSDKVWVREGALRVLSDDKNCQRIITGAPDSKRPGFYFAMCKGPTEISAYNVFFQWNDVNSKALLKPASPIDEATGRKICEAAIKQRAQFPSTVDIKWFSEYSSQTSPDGSRVTMQGFTAKNAFGLQLDHIARCVFTSEGKLGISISERQ